MELVGAGQGRDKGRQKNALTPTTFSLLHATDFADRQLYNIVPPLKGMIVLATGTPTAFARDVARGWTAAGCANVQLRRAAGLALYFRAPIDTSLDRLMARRVFQVLRGGHGHGWSQNLVDSFRIFQGKVLDEYDRLIDEFGLSVVDVAGDYGPAAAGAHLVSRQLEMPAPVETAAV